MKTDELINALAADNATKAAPIGRTLHIALAIGAAAAVALFVNLLHMRSDFGHAITHDLRFMFKFVFTLGLAVAGALLVVRLSRPEGRPGALIWLLAMPLALLALAVGLEMIVVPADHWIVSAMGSMPGACVKYIPMLAAAPLVVMLLALRQGAPSRPAAAGAAAGLVSAAIGAALYATFCVDDSPLFLAIWYMLGIGAVVAAGALIGGRVLRW